MIDMLNTPPQLFSSLPLLPRANQISSAARLGDYDCLYLALAAPCNACPKQFCMAPSAARRTAQRRCVKGGYWLPRKQGNAFGAMPTSAWVWRTAGMPTQTWERAKNGLLFG